MYEMESGLSQEPRVYSNPTIVLACLQLIQPVVEFLCRRPTGPAGPQITHTYEKLYRRVLMKQAETFDTASGVNYNTAGAVSSSLTHAHHTLRYIGTQLTTLPTQARS